MQSRKGGQKKNNKQQTKKTGDWGKKGGGIEVELELGNKRLERLCAHGLWSLNGEAEGTVPDKRRQDTERARHAKQHRVKVLLSKAVVGEEDAAVGIDVGPGVGSLALLKQNVGHNLVQLAHKAEELVIGQVLERKLALACVAGVGLAKNSVAIAGHNLARLERGPHKLLELLVGKVLTNKTLHLVAQRRGERGERGEGEGGGRKGISELVESQKGERKDWSDTPGKRKKKKKKTNLCEPLEDLLVGETMEGASKTRHAGGKGKVGV